MIALEPRVVKVITWSAMEFVGACVQENCNPGVSNRIVKEKRIPGRDRLPLWRTSVARFLRLRIRLLSLVLMRLQVCDV